MSLNLPESYWDDVNRYCGEILAGAEVRRSSIFVIGVTIQEARWEAEAPNTTAALDHGVIHYMGGLITRRTSHTLALKEPTPGTDTMVEYSIDFYPNKQKISSVDNGLEYKPPMTEGEPTLRTLAQDAKNLSIYLGERKRDQREKKAQGLHIPAQEDYDRLHSELKRGASGTYAIKDPNRSQ